MPVSPTKWFSAPVQNVVFTYVCLISNVKPNLSKDNFTANRAQHEDEVTDLHENSSAMALERSKALEETPEGNEEPRDASLKSNIKTDDTKTVAHVTEKNVSFIDDIPTSSDATNADELSEDEKSESYANPRILKLTRMQWLTDSREGSIDASPSMLTLTTRPSITSYESELDEHENSESERCLSTILRLDKEHNLFGLSNITIISPKHSIWKMRRERCKAVFPQTTIISVCCYGSGCCRNKTSSALPASLRCGRCHRWCSAKIGCVPGGCKNTCSESGCPSCKAGPPPKPKGGKRASNTNICSICPFLPCSDQCPRECLGVGGLTVKVLRKQPPVLPPDYPEITPQGPSRLLKPVMARSCHHIPRCIPPSSMFPYTLPCYWQARPDMPCIEPANCFHNPPCIRRETCCKIVQTLCDDPCAKCKNDECIGVNDPKMRDALKKHGFPWRSCHHETKKKKTRVLCQCILPMCKNCFVRRPEKNISAEVVTENVRGLFDVDTFEGTRLIRSSGIPRTKETQTNEQAQ